MTVKENYCNGCETCIGCERGRDVESVVCDECGADLVPIYAYNGKELCAKCIVEDLDLERVD